MKHITTCALFLAPLWMSAQAIHAKLNFGNALLGRYGGGIEHVWASRASVLLEAESVSKFYTTTSDNYWGTKYEESASSNGFQLGLTGRYPLSERHAFAEVGAFWGKFDATMVHTKISKDPLGGIFSGESSPLSITRTETHQQSAHQYGGRFGFGVQSYKSPVNWELSAGVSANRGNLESEAWRFNLPITIYIRAAAGIRLTTRKA